MGKSQARLAVRDAQKRAFLFSELRDVQIASAIGRARRRKNPFPNFEARPELQRDRKREDMLKHGTRPGLDAKQPLQHRCGAASAALQQCCNGAGRGCRRQLPLLSLHQTCEGLTRPLPLLCGGVRRFNSKNASPPDLNHWIFRVSRAPLS